MNLENLVNSVSRSFSFLPVNEKRSIEIDRQLQQALLEVNGTDYYKACLGLFLISFFLSLTLIIISIRLMLVGAMASGMLFLLLLKAPAMIASRVKEKTEEGLALFLYGVSFDLSSGLTIDEAVKRNSFNPFDKVIKKAISRANKGDFFLKAFLEEASVFCSKKVDHAVNLLFTIEKKGIPSEVLAKAGKEFMLEQKLKLREKKSKLSLLALVFVAVVVVAPGLVEGSLVISSIMLGTNNTLTIFLLIDLIIPVIGVGLLWMMKNL